MWLLCASCTVERLDLRLATLQPPDNAQLPHVHRYRVEIAFLLRSIERHEAEVFGIVDAPIEQRTHASEPRSMAPILEFGEGARSSMTRGEFGINSAHITAFEQACHEQEVRIAREIDRATLLGDRRHAPSRVKPVVEGVWVEICHDPGDECTPDAVVVV